MIKTLSPYAFTNQKFRIIRKSKKWFNFKFEVIYFSMLWPGQIKKDNGYCLGILKIL
jgi:hypothetical protein